jgi:hypothetical protein
MECKSCKEEIVTNRHPYISIPLYPYESKKIDYFHVKCLSDVVWYMIHNDLNEYLMMDIRTKNVSTEEFTNKYHIKQCQQDHMEWNKRNNKENYERLVEKGWKKAIPWWEGTQY